MIFHVFLRLDFGIEFLIAFLIEKSTKLTSMFGFLQVVCSADHIHVVFGAAAIPHPAKAAKGGEDAFLFDDERSMFGVADGVGGSIDLQYLVGVAWDAVDAAAICD